MDTYKKLNIPLLAACLLGPWALLVLLEIFAILLLASSAYFAVMIVSAIAIIAGTIAGLIMLNRMVDDMNRMFEKDDVSTMNFILAMFLSCVTLSIFGAWYLYSRYKRMHNHSKEFNIHNMWSPGTVLLLIILAYFTLITGLIAIFYTWNTWNKFVDAANTNYNRWEVGNGKTLPPQEPTATKGYLKGLAGEMYNQVILIYAGDEIIIGRDPKVSNLLISNDKHVSRKHCKVNFYGTFFSVTDYSSNGTKLGDGRKLEKGKTTNVKNGEVLVISDDTKFLLNADEDATM